MKPQGMVSGRWYALLRGPKKLPVLFCSREDARQNQDSDEYIVRVHVRPLSARDLLRGEQALLAAKRRPRLPLEQKRRRGSALRISTRLGAFVELSGDPPYLGKHAEITCQICGVKQSASEFVKLLSVDGKKPTLRIGWSCNGCEPSAPIPFVKGLRFVKCWDLDDNPVLWQQRDRERGAFGDLLTLDLMDMRRMTTARTPDGRPIIRPEPSLVRGSRAAAPRVRR